MLLAEIGILTLKSRKNKNEVILVDWPILDYKYFNFAHFLE